MKNNPVKDNRGRKFRNERGRSFFANRDDVSSHGIKGCLYSSSDEHRAINCDKVVKPENRKKILAEKHLCFNCTGAKYRAVECKNKGKCQVCQRKHHTSICEPVTHPVVVVRINGYKFRALHDSGASHSYASFTAIKPTRANLKSTYWSSTDRDVNWSDYKNNTSV